MNFSLRQRVTFSFVVANIIVLVVSFFVFHFLNSLNRDIEDITVKSNKVSLLTDEIRISAVSILKYQRRILINKGDTDLVDRIINLCESFTSQLQTLDTHYKDPEIKKVVAQMLSYVDSLKLVLSKASLFHRDTIGMSSIGELADKILESFSEFQDIQYKQARERDKKIKGIIKETKRNMMITLIIAFLGTILLGLIMPGKIALPFKKIKDAIRELQECNFDVNIYYSQDDEIGEIANEMNKMIHSFKVFEELRIGRISVEQRKFDALANMVKRPVLVANAEGKIVYMNNQLYSLMQVQTDDVIGKEINESVMPPTIVESFELAIKRRSKIENHAIVIPAKITEEEAGEKDIQVEVQEVVEDSKGEDSEASEEGSEDEIHLEVVYKGYANVIPIRGKESALDYYLMVLSKEVFS